MSSPHIPALVIVAALLAVLSSACTGGDNDAEPSPGPEVVRPEPQGEPRSVALGFAAFPAEDTTASYIRAFATAAQYGEVILIQRAPPWEDFLPNRQISQQTLETTRLETALIEQYGLRVIYAIDPTDPAVERNRLANLPPGFDQAEGLTNEDLRTAFVAYTRYIVRNYDPEYLAIGVEVNMTRDRARPQFDSFVSLYDQAYQNAKDAAPDIKVFPTFQLEDIEGTLSIVHPPSWEALEPFAGRMDVLAVSSYPYLADLRTAQELQEDYYTQLGERFEGEVMLFDVAYPSAPVDGFRVVGTEDDQFAFLERLLNDSEDAGFSTVIWRAALNPTYAQEGSLAAFRDVGLRFGDGSNKLAWGLWEEWARRPYEPESGDE